MDVTFAKEMPVTEFRKRASNPCSPENCPLLFDFLKGVDNTSPASLALKKRKKTSIVSLITVVAEYIVLLHLYLLHLSEKKLQVSCKAGM